MKSGKIIKRFILLLSLVMLITSTIGTTYGYIVTSSNSAANTFVPSASEPEDITVTIEVVKKMKNTGTLSIAPAGFAFVLENTASGEKKTLETDQNGVGAFTLGFTSADAEKLYTYKLWETNDGREGVTYDTRVYDISVDICSETDGKPTATVTVNGKATEKAVLEFINTYHTPNGGATKTGDNSNGLFWLILAIFSGGICLLLITRSRTAVKKRASDKTEPGAPEGFERCALCGRLTPIPVSMPVDWREDYEMGFGQICIYCKKEMR